MSVKRGDVVLIPVPDTSGRPGKTRPVLVVSSDLNNHRLQDAIVVVMQADLPFPKNTDPHALSAAAW
jgi:mRNA-degrading endonuclease toxin of MazEF toxin-antitoxin module